MAGEWPLRSYLELGALPGAVPCARLHARQMLWEWGLSAFSENAELLVSELVTNAIQASVSAEWILPVRLWLSSDGSRLLIQVQDSNRYPPARNRPAPTQTATAKAGAASSWAPHRRSHQHEMGLAPKRRPGRENGVGINRTPMSLT
jgi:hypothetical protein